MPASWYGNSIRCMDSPLSGVIAWVGVYHGRRGEGSVSSPRASCRLAFYWTEDVALLTDPESVSVFVHYLADFA